MFRVSVNDPVRFTLYLRNDEVEAKLHFINVSLAVIISFFCLVTIRSEKKPNIEHDFGSVSIFLLVICNQSLMKNRVEVFLSACGLVSR